MLELGSRVEVDALHSYALDIFRTTKSYTADNLDGNMLMKFLMPLHEEAKRMLES